MKTSNHPFVLFSVASLIVLGIALYTLAQMTAPEDEVEIIDELVEGVRIIPPSPGTLDSDETSEPTDWADTVAVLGIDVASEKCTHCHYTDRIVTEVHPGDFLNRHPPEAFGCVLCHGGNGHTVEKQVAHSPVPGDVLLNDTRTSPFLKGHQVEANCGKCHTEPAVPDALYLSGGRFVLNKYGCLTCHDLPVEIPIKRYAPSLDYIGNKVSKVWLRQWLEDPTIYLPASKMPKLEMTESERESIVGFLETLRDDTLLKPLEGMGDPNSGRKIFVDYECQACHTLHGKGDPIGPELEKVGTKVNRPWLMTYLRNPSDLHPNTKMPDYEFTDQEILDMTEYLMTDLPSSQGDKTSGEERGWGIAEPGSDWSSGGRGSQKREEEILPDSSPEPRTPNPEPRSSLEEGFRLYISKGCAQCHTIEKYRKPDIYQRMVQWDTDSAIERVRAHRGNRLEATTIDIPDSDLELMQIALLAMSRNDAYKGLTYTLADGTLGDVDRFLAHFWQIPIPLQQPSPNYYNDVVSKLDADSCGTCHQGQWADWRTTRHAIAMGPGLQGQLMGQSQDFTDSCLRCHAPLSEQYESLLTSGATYAPNSHYNPQLQSHGLVCASCHVRGHQRFGPPFTEKAAAASVFAKGHHGGAVVSRAYEDSRFCSTCHQFEDGDFELNGKFLENTYNEWLESPQAEAGETCQSCHMPDRRHLWRGIHDADMVRNALRLVVKFQSRHEATRKKEGDIRNPGIQGTEREIDAEIRLTNEGAGHHLPTYVTPALFVTVRLLDTDGIPIADTEQVRVIQRRVSLVPGDYREVFDTRIPAGGTWAYRYHAARPENAASLEVRIDVHPDHFYNGFFRDFQAASFEAQVEIDKAYQTTEDSPYFLMMEQFSLGD